MKNETPWNTLPEKANAKNELRVGQTGVKQFNRLGQIGSLKLLKKVYRPCSTVDIEANPLYVCLNN